jgi:hypothetical protein
LLYPATVISTVYLALIRRASTGFKAPRAFLKEALRDCVLFIAKFFTAPVNPPTAQVKHKS